MLPAGYFKERCRRRNPCVTASGSSWDLVEYDGDRDLLNRRYGIPLLPVSVGWQSRRGPHLVYKTPPGEASVKVQIDETGVVLASDGYLVCWPAWRREHGLVYEWNGVTELAQLPSETRELLLELGRQGQIDTREHVANNEPVSEGRRHEALKLYVLQLIRTGAESRRLLDKALAFNRRRLVPSLSEKEVTRQVHGLARWAAQHPSEEELAHTEAERLADRVKRDEAPATKTSARARKVQRRAVAAVEMREIEYLDRRRHVPLRTITTYAGEGGLGKSCLVLAVAAEVTRRGEAALLVTYEDALAEVVAPRFTALQGDRELLHELFVDFEDGALVLPADLGDLRAHVEETGASMLIVDPLSASLDVRLDSHRDAHLRAVTGQLSRLADDYRLAVVCVAHLTKEPVSDAYRRVGGSAALYNGSRSLFSVTRCPVDPEDGRILVQHKANYARRLPPERWRAEAVLVAGSAGKPIEALTMRYVGVADDVDPNSVLGSHAPGVLDEARDFLLGALADGEWHDSAGLKKFAGVHERTLQRAAQALDVKAERRGFPASTWWRLPTVATALGAPLVASEEPAATLHEYATSEATTLQSRQTVAPVGGVATVAAPDDAARCPKHPDGRLRLARDGVWRCLECESPTFTEEIVEETE
jgi:hypothetical protein